MLNCYIMMEQSSISNSCNNQCKSQFDGESKAGKKELIHVKNPHLERMPSDTLYHIHLDTESQDLHALFGDVQFVCMGGTPARMKEFAYFIMKEIGYSLPAGTTLLDISKRGQRYSMFKVGPVLSVSHGMGVPSIGILLHEMIKLMYHAQVKDPVFFRIGTCGGIGIDGGNIVITSEALNGYGEPNFDLPVLGKKMSRPSKLDSNLAADLKNLTRPEDAWDTTIGKTMCADDFYEGQGRLDGAFCEYSEADKIAYLTKLHQNGVRNIEMEAVIFGALTHHAGIRAAIVCVTLLNRLNGDQINSTKEEREEWQTRPQKLVSRYIKNHLNSSF
jgi:uridine phosphorylase